MVLYLNKYSHITNNKKIIMFENFDDLYNKFFNENLGEDLNEPDKVVKFNKNGNTYEQRVWDLENGTIIKTSMVPNSSDKSTNSKMGRSSLNESLLNEALDLAVEEERYEDAAKIRDYLKK